MRAVLAMARMSKQDGVTQKTTSDSLPPVEFEEKAKELYLAEVKDEASFSQWEALSSSTQWLYVQKAADMKSEAREAKTSPSK